MFLAWEAIPTGPGLPVALHTSAGQLGAVGMSAPSLYTNEEMTVAFLWLPLPYHRCRCARPVGPRVKRHIHRACGWQEGQRHLLWPGVTATWPAPISWAKSRPQPLPGGDPAWGWAGHLGCSHPVR